MLGKADKKMHRKDSRVLYSLSLENAEQKNNLLLLCKEAGEATKGGEVGRDGRRRRPRLAARKGATGDERWRPRRAAR